MKSLKTTEEWKTLVNQYQKSGLSQSCFARENNIKTTTMNYWIKKMSKVEKPLNLVPISEMVLNQKSTLKISIEDIHFELPSSFSSDKIAKIISAIREAL